MSNVQVLGKVEKVGLTCKDETVSRLPDPKKLSSLEIVIPRSSSTTNFIDLDVTIPNKTKPHPGLRVGEQAFFEYSSRQYSITVLEINTSTATISVQEVLASGE